MKTPALQKAQKAKVAIQLYTGVVWGRNCFMAEYKEEEEMYGAWVAMEAIQGIKFSCLMFLILVVFVPAPPPAAGSGSAVPADDFSL